MTFLNNCLELLTDSLSGDLLMSVVEKDVFELGHQGFVSGLVGEECFEVSRLKCLLVGVE